ncbi:MerR family transcriptional regulator [Bacillus manliponensis]|uniref:MerR family transcriptional regulator n=1 Tax=Bacillus manliponensis TaxID=574376 RepID=A0A073JZW9_9BACI|nr:MerR family transcriptional regulator [Bacillus manliponensis]KEK20609.1 MerR family transcriptional regulator [Bacillus manliponensis]
MLLHKRFTIGEMAKMHRIPQSTLRYYDEKGIFQPAVVDENTQYRYYTIDQFSMLDTIKFLRHLNIPLKDIKLYIDERTPTLAVNMLEQQRNMMLQKQKEIEYILAKMNHKIDLITEALCREPNVVSFKQLPKRNITSLPVAPNATDEMFEYYIHSLQSNLPLLDVSLFSGDIGVTVPKEAVLNLEFQLYGKVFILLDYMPIEKKLETFEAGMYACAYHHGSYEETGATYELILQEIERNGYEICGDAIELGLVDWSVTEDPLQQVTEIQVPVCKCAI